MCKDCFHSKRSSIRLCSFCSDPVEVNPNGILKPVFCVQCQDEMKKHKKVSFEIPSSPSIPAPAIPHPDFVARMRSLSHFPHPDFDTAESDDEEIATLQSSQTQTTFSTLDEDFDAITSLLTQEELKKYARSLQLQVNQSEKEQRVLLEKSEQRISAVKNTVLEILGTPKKIDLSELSVPDMLTLIIEMHGKLENLRLLFAYD